MDKGLVTRGVNVRPHKRTFESAAPHGLRISSAYDPEGVPGRPLPGYRPRDFGLRTGRKRSPAKAPARIRPTVSLSERIEELETSWTATVADAQARKAQGIPHRETADKARRLRSQLLNLKGGVTHATEIEIVNAEGSMANAIKAA